MKTRIDKGSILEQRIKSRLSLIKSSIEINPKAGITKDGNLKSCLNALKKLGVVANYGTSLKPIYSWQKGIGITDDLVNRVTVLVREDIAAKDKKYRQSKKYKLNIEPAPETSFDSNATAIPAFSVSDFTDQELWDELKKRGYTANVGCLVRVVEKMLY